MKSKNDPYSGIIVTLASYACTIASVILYIRNPVPLYSPSHLLAFGLGLISVILGIWLRVSAVNTLQRMFTTKVEIVNDHKLVRTGPYHWLRHPSYTGAILIIAAPTVLYAQWILLPLVLLILVFAYLYRITIEERMLRFHFGDTYLEYMKRTRRLIPFVF